MMRLWLTVFLVIAGVQAHAEINIQQLVKDTFTEQAEAKTLWLDEPLQEKITQITNETYQQLRLRYWQNNNQRLWVLKAKAKGYPVHAAVVVEKGAVKAVEVLEYKGDRGSEIRKPFYLKQYVGVQLLNEKANPEKLNKNIDGITGATYSANAVKKIAKLALVLDKMVTEPAK